MNWSWEAKKVRVASGKRPIPVKTVRSEVEN